MAEVKEGTPLIEFDPTPDALGLGRVIVDGRFYGLPAAAVYALAASRKEVEQLTRERDEREETVTLQFAAIMTAAHQNTRDSVADRIDPESPYYTVAYYDICNAVDQEIRERERADAAESLSASLQQRVTELEKDAERYRWLRNESRDFDPPAGKSSPWPVYGINGTDCYPIFGSELDAAIDAARTQPTEKR